MFIARNYPISRFEKPLSCFLFRRGGALCLALLFCLAVNGCQVLFWKESVNREGGIWRNADQFIEIHLLYDSKLSSNPLNQQTLSRNYRTRLLLHSITGSRIQSASFAEYPGWTLRGSLTVFSGGLFAIRGLDDSLAGPTRELVFIGPFPVAGDSSPSPGKVSFSSLSLPPGLIMAARVSPDEKRLAVFLTDATLDKPTGRIRVLFYKLERFALQAGAAKRSLTLEKDVGLDWEGAPGLPDISWARDSSGIYVRRRKDVFMVLPATGRALQANTFPACFQSTVLAGDISPAGRRFLRGGAPDYTVRLEMVAGFVGADKIRMIRDFSRIGEDCPD